MSALLGDSPGARRYHRIAAATLMAWAARLVSVAVNLVCVPLAAHYLGNDRYGLWLLAVSLVSLLSFADLGLDSHLMTLIAQASGRGDKGAVRLYTASALWLLVGISTGLALMAITAWRFVPWVAVFNLRGGGAVGDAQTVAAIAVAITLANIFLPLAARIYYGLQEGWRASIWQIVASITTLAALALAVQRHAGLALVVLALGGAPVLIGAINLVWLFAVEKPWLFAPPTALRLGVPGRFLGGGIWMLLINLQSFFWMGKDNILIGHLFGPERLPPFDTTFRVYSLLLGVLVSQIMTSFWPAYAEASSSGEHNWVAKAFRSSLAVILPLFAIIAFVFAAAAPALIRLWAGPMLVPPAGLPWALALEFCALCWTNLTGYLLISLGRLRVVVITGFIAGPVSILLALVLAPYLSLAAVPIANLAALLLLAGVPMQIVVARILRGRASPAGRVIGTC